MNTETLKALHDDIAYVQKNCPLATRKAKLTELKKKGKKIEVKIKKRGIDQALQYQLDTNRFQIKLATLFVKGVSL